MLVRKKSEGGKLEKKRQKTKKNGWRAGASRSLKAYLPDRLSKCDRAESLEETQALDRLSV